MNIVEYVKSNWNALPKSAFNDFEVVIVRENYNDSLGYGHHGYSGVGIDQDGSVFWCFSSGCSCSGSCGVEHIETRKTLELDMSEVDQIDPENVDFKALEVSFADY